MNCLQGTTLLILPVKLSQAWMRLVYVMWPSRLRVEGMGGLISAVTARVMAEGIGGVIWARMAKVMAI